MWVVLEVEGSSCELFISLSELASGARPKAHQPPELSLVDTETIDDRAQQLIIKVELVNPVVVGVVG